MVNGSRGKDHGKCACDDCKEFERDSDVSCSYCACPTVRHAKLTASKNSLTSKTFFGTSHERGPSRWKEESLGWFP